MSKGPGRGYISDSNKEVAEALKGNGEGTA
jgi:hypothetical protein